MVRSTTRRATALTAVMALTAAGVAFGAVAPASAASTDIFTSTVYFSDVDDSTGQIDDAIMGSGTVGGWTDDAFDGAGLATIHTCGDAFGTLNPAFVVDSSTVNQGGTSTLVLSYTDNASVGDCGDATVVLTLTLQGNFARWSYAFSGDVDGIDWFTNLGSDGDETIVPTSNGIFVTSDINAQDPSMAFSATTNGAGTWDAVSGNGGVEYNVTGSPTSLELVVALADYSVQNGQPAANASLTSIAPTLATSSFGLAFPVFTGADAPSFAALSYKTTQAVNQAATYTYSPTIYGGADYFDVTQTGTPVYATVGTLPAGLTAVVTADANGVPVFTITGTPSAVGTFSVPVLFSLGDATGSSAPLPAVLSITVTGATLAATGTDSAAVVAGGIGTLGLGLMAVFMTRRRLRLAL